MSAPTTDSQMYLTMHRQPEDLRRVLADSAPVQTAAQLIAGAERVWVVGIGTSYHAALYGSWALRAAGKDARAVSSHDFAVWADSFGVRPADAVVVMAHTGVKAASAEALQVALSTDATVISIGGENAQHPGSQHILYTSPQETSAAYTTSHLCAMARLAQLASAIGDINGVATTATFGAALDALPDQIAGVLARQDEILPLSQYATTHRIYATGAGPNETTALESVIKVREAAYGWIDALGLEQFLHGPMVAVNAGDVVALVHVPGRTAERTAEIARAAGHMGARIWLIGDAVEGLEADVFSLPHTEELISPLLAVVPFQILAYQMAAESGINPDTFRRDNPVYLEAFGLSPLRAVAR